MIPLSSTSWNLPVILAVMVVTQLIIRIEGDYCKEECEYGCEKYRPPGKNRAYEPTCDHISKSDEKEICEYHWNWNLKRECAICGPKDNKGKNDCNTTNHCENYRSWTASPDDKDGPFYLRCDNKPSGDQDRLDCEFWLSCCYIEICGPKKDSEQQCNEACEKFRPWAASNEDKDGPFNLNCENVPDEKNCGPWKTFCKIELCGPKSGGGGDQCADICEKFRPWAASQDDMDGPFEFNCNGAPGGTNCEAWKSYCNKFCAPKNSNGNSSDQCEEPCNKFRQWVNPNKNGPYALECRYVPDKDQAACEYWKTVCPQCGRKKIEKESSDDGVSTDLLIVIGVTMLFLVSCVLAIGACAWSTNRNYWRYKNWLNQPPGQDGVPPAGDGGVSDKNQNDSVTVGGVPTSASGRVPNPSSNGPQ